MSYSSAEPGPTTLTSTATVDSSFVIGAIDRRLFGSFVEHMGRCVYGGVFAPGDSAADQDGFRTDVLELTRELGTTLVRYPGGNFVSGFRWEDSVGPLIDRPRRLDLAWRSLEPNTFGLDEFIRWTTKANVEPMMAVNLGSRGIEAACGLLEYANHPGGTAWSDLRIRHGAIQPYGIKLWCLGNEMDGPWQIGHKTAETYGHLAAETAKAMRQIDPSIELVLCGSSNDRMPTFGSWEATVLESAFDHVDYLSLHAYYEPVGGDVQRFLASGDRMDHFIEGVVATTDHVAARRHSRRKLKLSFDEWNVWYESRFVGHENLNWASAPALIEDQYTALDAVAVGALLMSLLRHADRVAIACLAQLVNVIAPIRTEPGQPAWRQTIFYPVALTAAHARGKVLRTEVRGDVLRIPDQDDVTALDLLVTQDEEAGEYAIFAVNRSDTMSIHCTLTLRDLPRLTVIEQLAMGGGVHPLSASNSVSDPYSVIPQTAGSTQIEGHSIHISLHPASWNLIRLGAQRGPRPLPGGQQQ
jgi:alpha-N-arabinofuranosidase